MTTSGAFLTIFRPLAVALVAGLGATSAVMSEQPAPAAGGDVFSTTTDQSPPAVEDRGGLPGEPAIDRYGRDPECGGTDRTYYDRMYGVPGVVVSPEEANADYRKGDVIRCAACGTEKEICWLSREGGEDSHGPLIAQALQGEARQDVYSGGAGASVPAYPAPQMVGPPPGQRQTAGVQGGQSQSQQARNNGGRRLSGGATSGRNAGTPANQAFTPVDPVLVKVRGYDVSVGIPRNLRTGVQVGVNLQRQAGSTSPWVAASIILLKGKAPGQKGLVRFVSVSDGTNIYPVNLLASF